MLTRREFMAAGGTAALAGFSWAADAPRDVRITRVTSLQLLYKRPKYVGKNAKRDDHGELADDCVLRIRTNAGIESFGHCYTRANQCAELLGKNPFDFFRADEKRMVSPLGRQSSPLWDLVGKLLNKPVYELLGGAGPGRVSAYDGTIYLIDLMPEYRKTWRGRFRQELDMGLKRGHRAFKVKIGRGRNWMLADEGYARDVEVLKLIREHVGPDVAIGVDANTTYGLEQTKRLLADLSEIDFAFVEEMFPDSVEQFLELKAFMKQRGLKTLLADGENHHRLEGMKPWADAKAVDIYQADMNALGFEQICAEAAMVRPAGGMIAPHNWGSLLGYYLQLQVGRAIDNFYRAEQDFMTNPALIADGYELKDGTSSVPDTPGLGLTLDDRKLPGCSRLHFDYKV